MLRRFVFGAWKSGQSEMWHYPTFGCCPVLRDRRWPLMFQHSIYKPPCVRATMPFRAESLIYRSKSNPLGVPQMGEGGRHRRQAYLKDNGDWWREPWASNTLETESELEPDCWIKKVRHQSRSVIFAQRAPTEACRARPRQPSWDGRGSSGKWEGDGSLVGVAVTGGGGLIVRTPVRRFTVMRMIRRASGL
ncbi:uncharacterized protein LY79DRAFT_544953 [Colletotrichum navitas]|uniref:Uncharacterized protein n=1 Tax=Colletotrichum navitas TaxID=681940 RepID=A0AAD8Q672_9PEZI|nr:uncharacterized protein LY79DRAFT_544953 [Colletotrichum navitas]KAK1595978.1 hypothetical protein LY79DRAFT_544953 [Colletotrichum navitas]